MMNDRKGKKSKLLVLHGNRQTGQLLLGRLKKLERKLQKPNDEEDLHIEMIAPDAPFDFSSENADDDSLLKTWWHRMDGNNYVGLEESLAKIRQVIQSEEEDEKCNCKVEGILGFSQGARLAHFLAILHSNDDPAVYFPNLRYIILVSGYDTQPPSLPINFPLLSQQQQQLMQNNKSTKKITIPSLHILGLKDQLVLPEESRALLSYYENPVLYEHEGNHYVPVKAQDTQTIRTFIQSALQQPQQPQPQQKPNDNTIATIPPDEEHEQIQMDECESLSLIFTEEFKMISNTREIDEYTKEYEHPIQYLILIQPEESGCCDDDKEASKWPKRNISIKVIYPPMYPDVPPQLSLHHDMNLLEFKLFQTNACLNILQETAASELGMPCIMSCVYALRDFIQDGGLLNAAAPTTTHPIDDTPQTNKNDTESSSSLHENNIEQQEEEEKGGSILSSCSKERIKECNLQGLQIASSLLGEPFSNSSSSNNKLNDNDDELQKSKDDTNSQIISNTTTAKKNETGNGGTWRYTIGLVGKPSAGKSTFFNAATAFARQRGGDGEDGMGGATMAPHPFTTIDPNLGYCLVPAPPGSCPEDNKPSSESTTTLVGKVGCTHGRDSKGRRLIPVMLKDVAGLVPGAYQGRGRGNKFLDDLTDADVLIHVVDVSGTADTEGNTVGGTDNEGGGSHPLNDLAWVQNELIEWVYSNLASKWDNIVRRGKNKLAGMFSGYKQNQAFIWGVLLEVEKFMEEQEGRYHALDRLESWDSGDLHRLVSAFLGARFPMALALNKSDIPSAKRYVDDVCRALPVFGAHIGVPMSAKKEMSFVRHHIIINQNSSSTESDSKQEEERHSPLGVWGCLQSALRLREPVLVFPVNDMTTYEPLPGMAEQATRDSSLPNFGMISCLEAAGGSAPTLWNHDLKVYSKTPPGNEKKKKPQALRDVIVLKPGSTVEDVFWSLKWMGVLGGEFVRCEGTGYIGGKPKLLKKDDRVSKHNCILKIMSTKKKEWQKKN